MTVSEKPARRRRKLWIILGAVVIAAVAVVGSLAYVSNRPGAAPLPPTGPNVTMWDNGFCSNSSNCGYSPVSKNVTAGTALTWTNMGGKPHTATECVSSDSSAACPDGAGSNTSGARAFDSNNQYSDGFKRDQQFSFTFDLAAGTYHYYCTVHLFMHGTITVQA